MLTDISASNIFERRTNTLLGGRNKININDKDDITDSSKTAAFVTKH